MILYLLSHHICPSQRCLSRIGLPLLPVPTRAPSPGEHVQLFRMKRVRNKGFYSEECQLQASIALCFEWAGYFVPRDVLPPFHNIVACTEQCVQQTPVRTVVFQDLIVHWTCGGGGGGGNTPCKRRSGAELCVPSSRACFL